MTWSIRVLLFMAAVTGLFNVTSLGLMLQPAWCVQIPEENPCADPQTQAAINTCAAQEYQKADAALNAVYRQVLNNLNNPRKGQLKAVQVAWVKFREAHCKFESDPYEGGSLHPTVYYGCMTSTAKSRTAELQTILDELKNQ